MYPVSFNGKRNQISFREGTTETFFSYETRIASVLAGSAIVIMWGGSPYRWSTTTSRNFNDWLEWCLLKSRPIRKDVEKWMKAGYIPASANVYNTDFEIIIKEVTR